MRSEIPEVRYRTESENKKLEETFKTLLPVLLMIKDFESLSPEEIMDRISLLSTDSALVIKSLDAGQRKVLRSYLKKWNIKNFMKGDSGEKV